MRTNIETPGLLTYVPVPGQPSTILVGGVAGWIDDQWDLSASLPVGVELILIMIVPAAPQNVGCRPHGGTIDCSYGQAVPGVGLANVGSDRHCDCYRAAGDNTYLLLGYFTK